MLVAELAGQHVGLVQDLVERGAIDFLPRTDAQAVHERGR